MNRLPEQPPRTKRRQLASPPAQAGGCPWDRQGGHQRMQAPWRQLIALWMGCVLAACGSEAGQGSAPDTADLLPANRFAEDFPAIASMHNADVWVACQQWDGQRDSIALGLLTEWESEVRLPVYTSPTHIHGLAMARGAGDVLQLVWSEQVADGWALRGVEVTPPPAPGEESTPEAPRALDAGLVSEPTTLVSAAEGHCTVPRLVADEDGRLLLAWVAVHSGGLTLRARACLPNGGWGPVIDVAQDGPENQWAPDLAVVAPGRFAVVWDAAVDGDFDIYLARLALDDGDAGKAAGAKLV